MYMLAGHISLLLGIIGIPLPLLPTTPFVLLAAFFYSRGSPRLHSWLINHKLFGPMILDWERYGVIRVRVKIIAISMIVIMLSYPIIFLPIPLLAKILAGTTGVCVVIFLLSRPSEIKAVLPAESNDMPV